MDFNKYQATGNDFILLEDENFPTQLEFISKICHRNLGLGADGVLLLQKSRAADVKMRIFNQDGSEATMCGNGLRCVIKHLKKSISIETKGGISLGEYSPETVRVTLPQNEITQANIQLSHDLKGHLVNTGTPHLVIFTEKLDNPQIVHFAKNFRTSQNINVNLANVTSDGIHVRTFEKGVATETLSCGTGGAAVATLYRQIQPTTEVQIHYPTATLSYTFDSENRIWMQGPVAHVFSGQFVI